MRHVVAITAVSLLTLSGCVTTSAGHKEPLPRIKLTEQSREVYAAAINSMNTLNRDVYFAAPLDGSLVLPVWANPEYDAESRAIALCQKFSKSQCRRIERRPELENLSWDGKTNYFYLNRKDGDLDFFYGTMEYPSGNLSTFAKSNCSYTLGEISGVNQKITIQCDDFQAKGTISPTNAIQTYRRIVARDSDGQEWNGVLQTWGRYHEKTPVVPGRPIPPDPDEAASASMPTVAPSAKGAAGMRPIAVSWGGFDELFAGTAMTNEKTEGGTIRVALPGGKGDCQGTYTMSPTGQGSWVLNCANGLSAVGQFQGQGANKGAIGQGMDRDGRTVQFTIGPVVTTGGPELGTSNAKTQRANANGTFAIAPGNAGPLQLKRTAMATHNGKDVEFTLLGKLSTTTNGNFVNVKLEDISAYSNSINSEHGSIIVNERLDVTSGQVVSRDVIGSLPNSPVDISKDIISWIGLPTRIGEKVERKFPLSVWADRSIPGTASGTTTALGWAPCGQDQCILFRSKLDNVEGNPSVKINVDAYVSVDPGTAIIRHLDSNAVMVIGGHRIEVHMVQDIGPTD